MRSIALFTLSVFLLSADALAASPPRPTLVVAISVDQYSADLFNEYRGQYKEGLATLASGVVFPRGYQSHASTETCPGHSTILTGMRPAHTGIIANDWMDLKTPRSESNGKNYSRYCVNVVNESGQIVVSPEPLLVPTLGDRLHAADPKSRTVAIAGKDRAAVMMGGHNTFLTLWWSAGKGFVTYPNARIDAPMQSKIDEINGKVKRSYETVQRPVIPAQCRSQSKAVKIRDDYSVGELHDTPAGASKWRATPAFDSMVLAMASAAIDNLQLGKRDSVDVLAVSFSATDYVGHYFGTEGQEMCVQQLALDKTINALLTRLDQTGVSYVVALTADHGGLDIPERNSQRGVPGAERLDAQLSSPDKLGAEVAKELGLSGTVLLGDVFASDIYLAPTFDAKLRPTVLDAVRRKYEGHKQVAKVFSKSELAMAEPPHGPPDQWSLIERAKASFNAERSGDLVVLLKPYVTLYGIPKNTDKEYLASHGSPWDYDRRVPILFWWRGITGYEQPAPVETVDIAPTLADLVGLKVGPNDMDGRVLQVGQR